MRKFRLLIFRYYEKTVGARTIILIRSALVWIITEIGLTDFFLNRDSDVKFSNILLVLFASLGTTFE